MGLLLVGHLLWEILNYCKCSSLFTNSSLILDIDILSLDHLNIMDLSSFWLLLGEVLYDGQCGGTSIVFVWTFSEGIKCLESFIVVISINICVNLSCNKSNIFLWFTLLKLYLFLGLWCLHNGRSEDGCLWHYQVWVW